MPQCRQEIAAHIDHAILSPAVVARDLEAGCRLARKLRVASVCVRPSDLRRCAELLLGSRVAASTVVGFPHGGQTRGVKVSEAREAIEEGVSVLTQAAPPLELDAVVNIGRVLSGDWTSVRDELTALRDITAGRGAILKVIFETAYLEESHIRRLCELCGELKADFVKTSTGFGPRGASIDDVRLMRDNSPADIRVKASGGIRTLAAASALLDAGADRIGTSSTEAILAECEER